MSNRRTFLKTAAMGAPAAILAGPSSLAQSGAPTSKKLAPNSITVDKLPQHFDVEPGIHNLENGYWGITPKSVAQVYAEQTAFVTKTNSIWAPHEITARVPAGTINFAAVLSIPAAVEFHYAVGASTKEKHMRSLRNRWVDKVRNLPNVEICVPDDPGRYCAITSFRLMRRHRNSNGFFSRNIVYTQFRVRESQKGL